MADGLLVGIMLSAAAVPPAPTFRAEPVSERVGNFLAAQPSGTLAISQWTCVEFATRLRGPDALHMMIARNNGVEEILTLDDGLLFAARKLKLKARRGVDIRALTARAAAPARPR